MVQTREQNAAQGTGDSQKKKRGWEEEEEEEEEEEAFENTQTHTHMLSLSHSHTHSLLPPPCLRFQPWATPALGIPLCASTPACEPWAAAPVLFHAQPSLVCIALVRETKGQHACVCVCMCVFISPFPLPCFSIENIACVSRARAPNPPCTPFLPFTLVCHCCSPLIPLFRSHNTLLVCFISTPPSALLCRSSEHRGGTRLSKRPQGTHLGAHGDFEGLPGRDCGTGVRGGSRCRGEGGD